MPNVGIYLAAGSSKRMGSEKLALPIGKLPLGSLALHTAVQSSLEKVITVVKEDDDLSWIPNNLLNNDKCLILRCLDAEDGQSASLRCGIRQAIEIGASSAVVLLADQPFITKQLIDGLVKCFIQNPSSKYVGTAAGETVKPPILFSATMFNDLLRIEGDKGARDIVRNTPINQGKQLPCHDNRLLFDIDTPADYEFILSELKDHKKTTARYDITVMHWQSF